MRSSTISPETIVEIGFSLDFTLIISNMYHFCYVHFQKVQDVGTDGNFSALTNCRHFVDETLLIAELFRNHSYASAIRAPPRFGKSTVLDMIKRFLAIPVNLSGIPIAPNTTENYKLFCGEERKLRICQQRQRGDKDDSRSFVENHLGRYPVVRLDYRPLKNLTESSSMMTAYRSIMAKTFAEHAYLRHDSKLFALNEEIYRFRDHYERPSVLEEEDVRNAFNWLCELLYRHFDNRKVVVLIDDYDASHYNGLLDGRAVQLNRLDEVIDYVHWMWLKKTGNEYVEFVLMTGVFRRIAPMGGDYAVVRIADYPFLGDHKFTGYFGLTGNQVNALLSSARLMTNDAETVNEYYGGYSMKNVRLFSLPSIVRYVRGNGKIDNYWPVGEYTRAIERLCRTERMREAIDKLLNGGNVTVRNLPSLSRQDAVKLNEANRQPETDVKNDDKPDGIYFLWLADLGLLVPTTCNGDTRSESEFVTLKIPNREIKMVFARMMKKTAAVADK